MGMYRVRTVWTGVAGSPYYSNLYFAEEAGTAEQARGAVSALFGNYLAQVRNDLVFTIEREVPVVDEETGDITRVDLGTSTLTAIGTSSEDPLAPALQLLVRLRTGVYGGGREIRGRIFIPGLTEVVSEEGVPNAGIREIIEDLVETMIGQANAQLVVWSKSRGSYAVVNSASVWNQWSVLRSRRD